VFSQPFEGSNYAMTLTVVIVTASLSNGDSDP
jgi:hypothetical protein